MELIEATQTTTSSPQPTTTWNQTTTTTESGQHQSTGHKETVNYERRVSSTILEEEILTKRDAETVRYVEVPEYIEVPRYVTTKSIVEVEKRVPKYEYEWVEKIVEVPEVKFVDQYVEVEQFEEVIKHVPGKKEIVEIKKEVVKTVPRIETKIVERVVEVPGEIIEVPKPYTIENKVVVNQFVDRERPVVIAQSAHPYLQDSPEDIVDIDVVEYEPQVVQVEVQVPKPIPARIWSTGMVDQYHKLVKNIPAAQYNTILKSLNAHLVSTAEQETLPFMRESDGSIAMLGDQTVHFVDLPTDVKLVSDEGLLIDRRASAVHSLTPPSYVIGQAVASRGVSMEAKETERSRKATDRSHKSTHKSSVVHKQSHRPSSHRPSSHRPSSHRPSSHRPSSHRPSSHRPSSHRPSSHRPSTHSKRQTEEGYEIEARGVTCSDSSDSSSYSECHTGRKDTKTTQKSTCSRKPSHIVVVKKSNACGC